MRRRNWLLAVVSLAMGAAAMHVRDRYAVVQSVPTCGAWAVYDKDQRIVRLQDTDGRDMLLPATIDGMLCIADTEEADAQNAAYWERYWKRVDEADGGEK